MSNNPQACPECNTPAIVGAEYTHIHPEHYDGISEWQCANGHRWGRWTGQLLEDGESETRYGGRTG